MLTVHRIRRDEKQAVGNEINFNRGSISDNEQCALNVIECAYEREYQMGMTFTWTGEEEEIGPPCKFMGACVYKEAIRERSPPNNDQQITDPPDDAVTRKVISHESGHMVSIPHYNWLNNAIWDVMVTYPDKDHLYLVPDYEDKLFTNTPSHYDDIRILLIRLHDN
jgi:hypothetical protein